MENDPLPVIAFALALTFVVSACNHPTQTSEAVTIEHEITPQPVRVGPATVRLSLADANRQPVTGASITLEGNMSHAGMGPVLAPAIEIEPGRYQATLDLTMSGDWIIVTQVTLASGQKLERQFDLKAVGAN